jgi:hypothetical protein
VQAEVERFATTTRAKKGDKPPVCTLSYYIYNPFIQMFRQFFYIFGLEARLTIPPRP